MNWNQRGQGVLESLLVLPLMILVSVGFAALLYRSVVLHFADYQAHEALICAQSESVSYCQKELEIRVRGILFSGSSISARISKLSEGHRATLEIHLGSSLEALRIPIKIEKCLSRI